MLTEFSLPFHEGLAHCGNDNLGSLGVSFDLEVVFDLNGEETFVEASSDWLFVRVLLFEQFQSWRDAQPLD